jgi:hypothetical protein
MYNHITIILITYQYKKEPSFFSPLVQQEKPKNNN